MNTQPFKSIGFWILSEEDRISQLKYNPESEEYPDPKYYVDKEWLTEERHLLISYLKKGLVICGYWGHSWCRFKCGAEGEEMGSKLLTDDIWAWPEGLVHYVEHHNVVLPNEFIEYCRSNDWQIPNDFNLYESTNNGGFNPNIDRSHDNEFWLEWSKRFKIHNK